MTANHMYYPDSREKFLQRVQTQLSLKPKIISGTFTGFPKSPWNFSHFEKKGQLHGWNILEVIDFEKCAYFNAN